MKLPLSVEIKPHFALEKNFTSLRVTCLESFDSILILGC